MSKYVANPVVVDAQQIVSASVRLLRYEDLRHRRAPSMDVLLGNGDTVELTPEMVARYIPKAGDYYVIQEDGYAYVNPKDVFERKYRSVQDHEARFLHRIVHVQAGYSIIAEDGCRVFANDDIVPEVGDHLADDPGGGYVVRKRKRNEQLSQ